MIKKVLFMAKAFGGGGAEVAMLELINRMPEEEYDITLALLDNDLEYYNRLKRKINIIQIKFTNKVAEQLVSMYALPAKILKKLGVNSVIPYYDMLFNAVANIFSDEYDLALDFYGYGYFLTGYMAEKIKAKKKATWLHDEDLVWFKNVKRYAGKFDKIFAVSEAVKSSFSKNFPELEEKTEVFYNTIDIDLIIEKSLYPCSERLTGDFIILTVGRLHSQKGYDIAIKTAKILKESGVSFKWYAIGAGKEKDKLDRLIEKCGVKDCFILLGRRDNPYTYMRQCDIYVQPSRHEGYVITLVEARALNLPIIASDIPSSREQIEDGKNGYIVALNEYAFASKIKDLYHNKELRNRVSEYLKINKPDFSEELKKLSLE